jgi:hypothetical protein
VPLVGLVLYLAEEAQAAKRHYKLAPVKDVKHTKRNPHVR